MDHGHHHGGAPGPLEPALTVLALAAVACGYLLAVRRAGRRNPVRGWNAWRTASFLGGLALLALALLPPLGPAAHTDFRAHMTQHMLIGMYAPLALVLAAPVTLLLRALPARHARRVSAALHSPPVRVVTHPAVALLLGTGTLVLLYFTPLYEAAMAHPAGHRLLHLHFLASGCLFAHVVAGPDPAPARPGVPARLVWLGVAIAAHALVSQALYGGFHVQVHAPAAQLRQGAEIMYYGGDLAELLLAGALVATWRPERRTGRRRPAAGPAHGRSAAGKRTAGKQAAAEAARAEAGRVAGGPSGARPPVGSPARGD
ncbi:cytochrome c oxidase assembly protein [Streptomyces sp. MJP52]|uniref:cytochrome c oxidase assembly protein n=1 Tax=Streptomyces sp. MJP52 TaxID=2940555 RepID=UPI00247660FB|nr:cytochrome c oxidase assembly protein [Streptomyces sp. MJP52]MDH6224460.1 putative membrane protein [Streptomyces sp. MJP52]